jgi:Flp pilus assembly protein TadG
MITFTKNKRTKLEKAQTMVEFALVFPLILIITYGIIEFGRMVFTYAAITSSAREGARFGASALNYDNCSGIEQAANKTAFLINNPTINIQYDKGPGQAQIAASCEALVPTAINLGDRIVVRVSTHYTPWIVFLGLSGFDITSTNARTILIDIKMPTPTQKP